VNDKEKNVFNFGFQVYKSTGDIEAATQVSVLFIDF